MCASTNSERPSTASSSERRPSHLRDLIQKIEAASHGHIAYSQAYDVIQIALDHLAARARIEEFNAYEGKHLEG